MEETAIQIQAHADAVADALEALDYTDYTVAYDTDGTIEVVIGFGEPIPTLDPSIDYRVDFAGVPGPAGGPLPGDDVVTYDLPGGDPRPLRSRGGMRATATFCDLHGCEIVTLCTTGFSVVSVASNFEGNSSAGHCDTVHDAIDSLDTVPLIFELEHEGEWGDVEWYRTGFGATDVAWFWYDYGENDRRKVESLEEGFSEGTWYCFFGRTTGYSCDKVRRTSVTHKGVRRLVQLEGFQQWYGDSGGPWYTGGYAAGLMRGFTNRPFSKKHSVFSKAHLLDEAIGVRVKISSLP